MANPDMSQYLGVFLDEGQEQLTLLEAEFLKMENGDHSIEILQSVFRAAHTLKGSSRAMGFLEIGSLTHEMENVLDDLRNGKIEVTTPIVDALLECLDALTALIKSVGDHGTDSDTGGNDIATLVAKVNSLRGGADVPTEVATPVVDLAALHKVEVSECIANNLSVFCFSLELEAECMLKQVRVYMATSVAEGLGTIIASHPEEATMEDPSFDGRFSILLATESTIEDCKTAMEQVAELQKIDIKQHGVVAEAPTSPAPVSEESIQKAVAAIPEDPAMKVPSPAAKQDIKPDAGSQTIRVGLNRLDALLNLVGELVIDRTQIARLAGDIRERHGNDEAIVQLGEALSRVSRITSELQEEVMKTRMLPIDGVFQRMPRMVRDLAKNVGKDVDFQVSGGETELDRSVLEVLADPLIHILRNSIDHGIEPNDERAELGKPRVGTVTMSARYEESHMLVEIIDDGRGIDPAKIRAAAVSKGMITEAAAAQLSDREALNLIMASGFSTAKVLSDISGRGVGMDIVKSNLDKIGGRVFIESKIGVGSKFSIHLPLTLAIVRALLVNAGGQTFVIPLSSVVEMLRLSNNEEITQTTVSGQAVIVVRGETIPLANLLSMLEGESDCCTSKTIRNDAHVVVVGHGEHHVGLCVDSVLGEQEIVMKSLGSMLGEIPGISGASILGDGRVALIVDAAKAIDEIRETNRPPEETRAVLAA